jgi:hypothetical protein
MKRQALLFFATIFSIFVTLVWSSCESCNTPLPQFCVLEAPRLLSVEPTSPTTAALDWTDVEGANGYRVVVIDLTDTTTFGTFNPVGSSLELSGLTPFHTYKADIRAKCGVENVSVNALETTWLQDGIIILDEVVMNPGTGLDDCTCTPNDGHQKSTLLANIAPNNIETTSSNQRVVFQIEVQYSGSIKVFKMGFDRNCASIKVFREACTEDKSGITVHKKPNNNNATSLEIKYGTLIIANVTPSFNGTSGGVSITRIPNCTINYLHCNGTWVPDCPTNATSSSTN